MLKITRVSGNTCSCPEKVDEQTEILMVTRIEMQKTRLRKETTSGTDVGLDIESGTILRNGDLLQVGQKTIMVQQTPEKVITIDIQECQDRPDVMVMIGHVIGNRHRPISVGDGVVSFPIQADTELETFGKLLAGVGGRIKMGTDCRVFIPHTGADVHGHQ